MTYRTTRRCDQDIIDIYVRGASMFGIEQAERYHRGLLDVFARLVSQPKMARLRTEFSPAMRMIRYRAHMIVYTEQQRDILIVRVLHGRQDWERHLG